MASTPKPTATPTARSTRATFFGLDLEYSSSAGTDLAEDSSVDCSNFLEGGPSGHSRRLLTPRGADLAQSAQRMGALPEDGEAASSSSSSNNNNNTNESQTNNLQINTNNDNSTRTSARPPITPRGAAVAGKTIPTTPNTRLRQQQDTLNILNDLGGNTNTTTADAVGLCTIADTTSHTAKSIRNIESQTMHVSNVHTPGGGLNLTSPTATLDGVYDAMPEDEKITAWAIHIALGFFLTLTMLAVFLSFIVYESFGLITLFLVSLMVVFFVFLASFVDKTVLSKNPQLKPVRRKIALVVQAAKQAIVDEVQLFHQEWKEHMLLLTDGIAEEDEEEGELSTGVPQIPLPKRKKSVFFRVVKPFVGFPRKLFRRRKNKNKQGKQNNSTVPDGGADSYSPPVATGTAC